MAAQEIGSLYVGLGFDTAVFDRQIVQIPQQAQKAAEGVKKGFQAASTHVEQFEKSTKSARAAAQNFSFQLNDIGTSLASGGSPLRVLAQQGGQVIQVFQQGGGVKSVLGEFARMLGGLFNPLTLVATAVTAVAVSVGFLTARAVENSSAMRQFGTMLKGLGLEGQATAAGLEEAAKRLKDVGLNAGDARSALTAATRAGISPAQAERVVRIGRNLEPALGENAGDQFVAAITGGIEPLAKMARQFGLITAAEVEAAREAAKFGKELSFIDRWVSLIEQHSKGLNEEALSPMGLAMRKLSLAFSELLDTMAKSDLILGIVNALTRLAGALKILSEFKMPDWSAAFDKLSGALKTFFNIEMPPWIKPLFNWVGGQIFTGAPSSSAPSTTAPATGGTGAGGYSTAAALALIAKYESSGGDPLAKNPKSSASGAWQFLDSTWREIAPMVGIDTSKYPTARSASLELQRSAATKLYEMRGFSPWAPWNPKLAAAIARGEGVDGGASGGATGSGSVLARPGSEEEFYARRGAEFKDITRTTDLEIASQGQAYRAVGRPRGAVEIQAGTERAQRYRDDQRFTPQAEDELTARTEQLFKLQQARARVSLAEGGLEERKTTEQLTKQASLFGESTQEIEKQVALLKIRQQAEAAGLALTDEAVKARESEATKLAETNALLAKQQSFMQGMREIAGVFESAFSSAFDSIVSGTFKARAFLGSLIKDLGKMIASQAFKKLLGGDDSGGGILGSLAGKLFGITGLGGSSSSGTSDFGGGSDAPLPAMASGGSFRVGGSGSIDSQLVAFRASPGEMVDVSPPGRGGGHAGGADIIRINLQTDTGLIAAVADQQIVTRSGQIVQVAVRQSQATVQRNFGGMSAEAQSRQM